MSGADVPPPTASPPVRLRRRDPASPVAVALLDTYRAEISALFGFDATTGVSADPEEMTPPRGDFLVAYLDDVPLGCGGVKLVGPGLAELKRMWVAPQARGRGVGRALLAGLEAAARDLGATRAVLDTHARLEPALRLYTGGGWQEVPAYNANPHATHWFAKSLQ
ncbi:MAG: GNAT family N-acetyltransferase [Kineosporiaceae bacterium]